MGEVRRRVGEGVGLRAEWLCWASAQRRCVFVIVTRVGLAGAASPGENLLQGRAAGVLGRRDVLRRAREHSIVFAIALFVLFLTASTGECSLS